MTCIFCQIIEKKSPANIIFENKRFLAFKDINPKAPIHYLIIPKEHIDSIKSQNSEEIVGDLIKVVKEIANEQKIPGYKLVFNVGKEGGQVIDHLHLHFLAGKLIEIP